MPQTFTIPGTVTGEGRIATPKWASLSDDIIFKANHSPSSMMHKPTIANWAEQPLLLGKSRMQKQGLKLQEIKITCDFHFSIRPFDKIKASLATAAANGTVLQWIFGTGEALGDFILFDWEEKYKKTDEEGRVYATVIELTLKEYAGPGVAEQTGIDAKKAAFANKPLKQSASLPQKTINSSETLSLNVQMVKMKSASIGKTVTKLQKGLMSIQRAKRAIQKECGKIKAAINKVDSAVAIARNIKNANSITAAASLVATATDSLSSATGGSPTISQLSSLAGDVSFSAGSLGQASEGAQVVKSWFATLGK